MDSTSEVAERSSSSEYKPLGWLESFLKAGAILASAVAAVGLPAVVFQYSRLNVPLDFVTKDAMFRAGLLPVFILVVVTFLAWLYDPTENSKRESMRVALRSAVRAKIPALLIVLLGTVAILVVLGILQFPQWQWYTVRSFVSDLFAPPYSRQKILAIVGIVPIIMPLAAWVFLIYNVARGRIDLRYLLAGRPNLWLDYAIFYLTILIAYSPFYPVIPYWAGGGRPRGIRVWIEQKSLPESVGRHCQRDGELFRCEGLYLVYANSEVFIIADGQWPRAQGIVLRRDIVKAVSTGDNAWLVTSAPVEPLSPTQP